MSSTTIFSSLRRSMSPTLETFLPPVDLDSDVTRLLDNLTSISSDLISSFSGQLPTLQKHNSKTLLRNIQLFTVLLDSVKDSTSKLPSTAITCFKELYLLFHRSKILLDYCTQSSKLWLLLHNQSISGHFYDLNHDISTLLDVFPLNNMDMLSSDEKEMIDLLRRQTGKAKLFIDKHDEALRLKLFNMLKEFETGAIPCVRELQEFVVERLAINDARRCRNEVEFLEELVVNHADDIEPSASVVGGLVAMVRYCRFMLFGFEEDEVEMEMEMGKRFKNMESCSITVPKDFCCPISLELMTDPVVVSTGQTYDRVSISRWVDEGHRCCPKSGQMLVDLRLVPNRVVRGIIMQWCMANRILYSLPDLPELSDLAAESSTAALASRAAVAANKATARLLIHQLANGSDCGKAIAAREIRFLAKTGVENRGFIGEYGAIPCLKILLSSKNVVAQENAVTALLNLSINDENKRRIMEENGCLESIVRVLRFGHTIESRGNAAATLFSLSSVHDYKKKIVKEDGAIEGLSGLLRHGTVLRARKDAVNALFNLSTDTNIYSHLIGCGAVRALVEALECDGVAEEAAGALALIVRQPSGAEAVGNEETAVVSLVAMMRWGTPKGKENAVAAILELCRSGGARATNEVLKAPALAGLLQGLLFTGTKRARRKAASLARVFQRCCNGSVHFGGLGVGYALGGNSSPGYQDSGFPSEMVVSVS